MTQDQERHRMHLKERARLLIIDGKKPNNSFVLKVS